VAVLPVEALTAYADVLDMLELEPWTGRPVREENPDGNLRTLPFASGGLVTYLILEREQEVHVLEAQWAG
jgi:hypothetical protein